jgi:hypothetical protein
MFYLPRLPRLLMDAKTGICLGTIRKCLGPNRQILDSLAYQGHARLNKGIVQVLAIAKHYQSIMT